MNALVRLLFLSALRYYSFLWLCCLTRRGGGGLVALYVSKESQSQIPLVRLTGV
jgi:hypothetical protein